MTASTEDTVGAALAGIEQVLDGAVSGQLSPATVIDRLVGYQHAIAAAGVIVSEDEALSAALIDYEAAPLREGVVGPLVEGFAAYRQAVHEKLSGATDR